MDTKALRTLSRKDLQKLAQREKIRANLKSETIIKMLINKFPQGVPRLIAPAPKRATRMIIPIPCTSLVEDRTQSPANKTGSNEMVHNESTTEGATSSYTSGVGEIGPGDLFRGGVRQTTFSSASRPSQPTAIVDTRSRQSSNRRGDEDVAPGKCPCNVPAESAVNLTTSIAGMSGAGLSEEYSGNAAGSRDEHSGIRTISSHLLVAAEKRIPTLPHHAPASSSANAAAVVYTHDVRPSGIRDIEVPDARTPSFPGRRNILQSAGSDSRGASLYQTSMRMQPRRSSPPSVTIHQTAQAQVVTILRELREMADEMADLRRQVTDIQELLEMAEEWKAETTAELARARKRRKALEQLFVKTFKRDERLHDGTHSWRLRQTDEEDVDCEFVGEVSDEEDSDAFMEGSEEHTSSDAASSEEGNSPLEL
ncbi:hypothetical protein BDW22DRAFT_1431384 [Trametopsis cervina]|nr:hypothetical protein BDW22DRAFT_1431384 [Trametopsis cervina]